MTVLHGPTTLATIATLVEAAPGLPSWKRRDLRSALKKIGNWTGRPLATLPSERNHLLPVLNRLHHAQIGVSEKRLANAKASVFEAIRVVLGHFAGLRIRSVLNAEWKPIACLLPKKPAPNSVRWKSLPRFLRFCSDRGISPGAVDEAVFDRYRAEDLEPFSVGKNVTQVLRKAMLAWNRAADELDGWPAQKVVPASQKRPWVTRPVTDFPPTFQQDLKRYAALLQKPHVTTTKGRKRKVYYAKSTIDHRLEYIRLAASVVVQNGRHIETLTSLADLIDERTTEQLLDYYCRKAGGSVTSFVALIAQTLRHIAEHHACATPELVQYHRENVETMRPPKVGLTEKNRERLRPFNKEENVQLLLNAPDSMLERVMTKSEKQGNITRDDALHVMVAAAMAILFYAPVRLGNLFMIKMDDHYRPPYGSDSDGLLVFEKHAVKNKLDLSFRIPKESVAVISAYLRHARPLLMDPTSPFLFPPYAKACGFAARITQVIKRHTGFRLNVHLFRHLMAKLYLDANPGDYFTVKEILGHTRVETTIAFYCGSERDAAVRHFDDTILARKGQTPQPLRKTKKQTASN